MRLDMPSVLLLQDVADVSIKVFMSTMPLLFLTYWPKPISKVESS
jgi:hypothetical protein